MNMRKSSVLLSRFRVINPILKYRPFITVPWSEKKHGNDRKNDDTNVKYKPLFFEMLSQAEAQAESKRKQAKKRSEIIKNISFNSLHQDKASSGNQSRSSNDNVQNNQDIEVNLSKKKKLKVGINFLRKEKFDEAMPAFTSVAQRLLDLSDRRIHPLYVKMGRIPIRATDDDRTEKSTNEAEKIPEEIRVDQQFTEDKPTIVKMTEQKPMISVIRNEMKQGLTQLGQDSKPKIVEVAVESK